MERSHSYITPAWKQISVCVGLCVYLCYQLGQLSLDVLIWVVMQVNVSSFICICGTVGSAAQCHGVWALSNWAWIWNDFIILHSPSWSDACRSYREIASCNYNKRGSIPRKGSGCLWFEKEDNAGEQLWIKAQSGDICCHSLQWGVIVAVTRQPPFHSFFYFLSLSLSQFLS